eukprot:1826859-Rhodomonas_salina.1
MQPVRARARRDLRVEGVAVRLALLAAHARGPAHSEVVDRGGHHDGDERVGRERRALGAVLPHEHAEVVEERDCVLGRLRVLLRPRLEGVVQAVLEGGHGRRAHALHDRLLLQPRELVDVVLPREHERDEVAQGGRGLRRAHIAQVRREGVRVRGDADTHGEGQLDDERAHRAEGARGELHPRQAPMAQELRVRVGVAEHQRQPRAHAPHAIAYEVVVVRTQAVVPHEGHVARHEPQREPRAAALEAPPLRDDDHAVEHAREQA